MDSGLGSRTVRGETLKNSAPTLEYTSANSPIKSYARTRFQVRNAGAAWAGARTLKVEVDLNNKGYKPWKGWDAKSLGTSPDDTQTDEIPFPLVKLKFTAGSLAAGDAEKMEIDLVWWNDDAVEFLG